jgi:hypothetical protein
MEAAKVEFESQEKRTLCRGNSPVAGSTFSVPKTFCRADTREAAGACAEIGEAQTTVARTAPVKILFIAP